MIRKFLAPMILLSSICLADSMDKKMSANTPTCKEMSKPCMTKYENNLFLEADFLYWYAKQDGNFYASTGSAATVPGTLDPNTSLEPGEITESGRVYAPEARMKPGFKVGAGINLEQGKWDLFTEYTHLYSNAQGSVSSNNINAGVLPLLSYTPNNSILSQTIFFAASGADGFVKEANAHWSLHFNTMTLELGRNLDLVPFLCLRPHFGLQGTWQQQHLKAAYDVFLTTSPSTFKGKNEVFFDQSSWGVGLRTGLNTVWKCCNHLELFANSAVSALWQGFSAEGSSYDTVSGRYDNLLIADQVNNCHAISPVIQIQAGLQSDWCFCNGYRFLVQAGWEEQFWFFQNQHSTVIAQNGLTLQGFTLKFRFDF